MRFSRLEKWILGLVFAAIGLAAVVVSVLFLTGFGSERAGPQTGLSVGPISLGGQEASDNLRVVEGPLQHVTCQSIGDCVEATVPGSFVRISYPPVTEAGDSMTLTIEVTNGNDLDWPNFNVVITSGFTLVGGDMFEGFAYGDINPPPIEEPVVYPGGGSNLKFGPIGAGETRLLIIELKAVSPGGYGADLWVRLDTAEGYRSDDIKYRIFGHELTATIR